MRPVRKLVFRVYHSIREQVTHVALERRRGIETARRVPLQQLGLAAPGRIGYAPSPLLALRRGLQAREIGPDDVFLDLGCGKGRILAEAAKRPFRRVIGVEIAPDLVSSARANLARVEHRCGATELVCADVLDYEIPDDVTIIYMYNPFRGAIFRAAIERIVNSLDIAPRRMTLIYRSPFEHSAIMQTGRFELVREYRGIARTSVGSALHVYEALS